MFAAMKRRVKVKHFPTKQTSPSALTNECTHVEIPEFDSVSVKVDFDTRDNDAQNNRDEAQVDLPGCPLVEDQSREDRRKHGLGRLTTMPTH